MLGLKNIIRNINTEPKHTVRPLFDYMQTGSFICTRIAGVLKSTFS